MKYFLFDLDGTLTDPFIGITNSVIYALNKMGISAPLREELRRFIGPPLIVSFKEFYGMTEKDADLAVKYYREYFSAGGIFENSVFEGIPELLDKLKKSNKKIYLATSKPEEYATQILERFSLFKYFDFVAGNTLKEERQTKESVIAYLLEKANIPPAEAVMIGDRRFDILAGKAFGLKTVGVRFGYAEKDELEEAGAEYIADTVEDLSKILLRL